MLDAPTGPPLGAWEPALCRARSGENPTMRKRLYLTFVVLFVLVALVTRRAAAAPEAHILRIDPRASQAEGAPILTTVIELVQNKRMSEAIAECASLRGDAQLDCQSEKLEAPQALYSPIAPFPEAAAIFTVSVDGADRPATFVSKARWGRGLASAGHRDGVAHHHRRGELDGVALRRRQGRSARVHQHDDRERHRRRDVLRRSTGGERFEMATRERQSAGRRVRQRAPFDVSRTGASAPSVQHRQTGRDRRVRRARQRRK